MIEKIKAYSKCKFDIENPHILLSCENLQGELTAGESLTQSFVIQSANEVPITGNVEVFDHRIQLVEGSFATTSFTVTFAVNAKGMQAGEEISGMFHILTNGGEYDLPYAYKVTQEALSTKEGSVSNLKEFAQLAQMHYEEALRVFTSEQFVPVLCRGELLDAYQRIYRSLRKSALTGQAMEEFLVTVGEKERMELTPARSSVAVSYDKEDVSKELRIRKNTWGYVNLQIQCDSPCIFLSKKELNREDFIGNEASVPIVIAIDDLPSANCTVDIRFFNTYQEFVISLKISRRGKAKERTPLEVMFSPSQLKKTYQKQLLADYLDYRVGKITLQEYTSRSIECANELMKFEEQNHWYRLIRLHMYIMKKDRTRVVQEMETISQYEDKMITDELSACYYGYLTALYSRDSDTIERVLKEIREEYEKQPDQFLLFFMILYLDESYIEDKNRIYEELSRIYDAGNNSPMLYYEVCELYNEYPNMLRELNEFALQAAYWGFARNYLNGGVRARFIELAHSSHTYCDKLFRTLDLLYRQQPEEKLLQVICMVLMKGRKMEQRYHHYYALGVERSFKLIGLMEYYMKSMDYDQYTILPQQVVIYFNYEEQRLNERQLAYLYANVVVNREAYGSCYEEYREPILQFLMQQVEKGAMNRDLAILYKEFFKDASVVASVAKHLPNVLFKQRFVCANPNITTVLVDYDECTDTRQVPVVDGVAYVDRITEHTNLTLVDREHKRYIGSVPYELFPIMEDENFLPVCYEADPKSFPVLLRLADYAERGGVVDYEVVKVYKALLEFDTISAEYRRRLNGAILHYYYQQYEGDIFEEYLRECKLDLLEEENRNLAIRYMVDRELYSLAMEAVHTYGYYGLPMEQIQKLCTFFVEEESVEYDELLMTMAFELFHNDNYNEAVLKYLIRFAKGGNRELLSIYQTAVRLQFDTQDLEERIVTQALLSDSYGEGVMEAFVQYTHKNPNTFLYEAFLNIMAHCFFMEQKKVPGEMLGCWLQAYRTGHLKYPLGQAAMLLACSDSREQSEKVRDVIEAVMQEFVRHDMLFPFFQKFDGLVELPKEMYIKSFLIYRSQPGHHVDVHYYRKGPKRPQSHTERMREYFDGYYVKDFVLFADEELQYYVTDEEDGVVKRIEAEELSLQPYLQGKQESRFAMINQMLTYRDTQNEEAFQEMLRLYIKDLYLIDSNMTLL